MPAITLGDLEFRVYSRLDGNTSLYTAAEVIGAINEQIAMVNWATGIIQNSATIYSVSNRVWYWTPAPILIPLRVQFEDRVLEPVDYDTIGCGVPRWTKITTAETQSPPANWVPVGFRIFGIHPADASGGALIQVTGVAAPPVLSLSTDSISISNEYADTISALAAQVLQLKESAVTFAQASLYYQDYLAKLKRLRAWRAMQMPVYFVQKAEAQR